MPRLGRIVVNGIEREVSLDRDRNLLHVLREELGLSGAKPGCGEGKCGACSVLLDGEDVRACQTPIAEADGRTVTTVEGLARVGRLHPIQRAFVELGAMQCGYCTAGMVVGTVALLAKHPQPTDAQIGASLEGHVCRCGTYPRIVRAVRRAAELATDPKGWSWPAPPAAGAGTAATAGRPRQPWGLLDPEARDTFEVLGDGLLAWHEPGRAAGGEVPGAAWTTSAGAWLHVGAGGEVAAFTGKVDFGQDNRTALSLLVADELRAPLGSVRLVMGDTDLCPFDMGTFGSRSTVDAGPNLRAAAAAARERLVGLAAERWGVEAAALVAEDGCVRQPAGDQVATYGELVRGLREVVASSAAARTPARKAARTAGRTAGGAAAPSRPSIVGRPTPKVTAPLIVTGAQRYPSDLSRPGMLYGGVLRPPAAGATLRSVDVAAAEAMPGVTVVREGAFVGVAAPDSMTARQAMRTLRAEWDLEPGPSEGELEAYLRSHPAAEAEEESWAGGFHHAVGDVDAALAAAPLQLAATYTTAYLAHAPLETRVALAEWEGERLTVWTGTQRPFGVRRELAEALGLAEELIRVVVPDTGGGWGGKHHGEVAIEAARLARAAGRPVKLRWSRGEEFRAAYFRPAAVIDVRSGAGPDGRIGAWEMRNLNSGSIGLPGPYEIPRQRLDFEGARSPFRQGSYRALASTANHFARESHMDEIAHGLGVDPLELRLRHLTDERLANVLRAAAERAGWAGRPLGPGRGLGIAAGAEKGSRLATCVEVAVAAGGKPEIVRIVSAFECGKIVNPENLANQVEGATVMGLGGALFEAVHFDAGAILNPSFTTYRLPRFSDVPPIEVVLLDRPDLPSAGAGEAPIIGVAPALANAIFDATGVRLRSLPLLPEEPGLPPG